ncbi:MAG: hypothetical protein WBD20_23800 [Pirellulaceae bacterium]
MKYCWSLILLMAVLPLADAKAQTLEESLIAENPITLAQQARKSGNVVRGAILFHHGLINCAKCHLPATEKDRIGPDLSRIASEVTDQQIIESILQPSKQISKGFETIKVLTNDGRVLVGSVVKEDDKEILIRDAQNVDRLITVDKRDVDEVLPGTKSSMPEGLVNELKDRQQFLDLLRYVFDVRERIPPRNAMVDRPAVQRELFPQLAGLILIQKSNCVACHQSKVAQSFVAAKKSPNLMWSGKWLNPEYLSRFIAEPHAVKPGTTMPNLLAGSDEDIRKKTADAIAHFLAAQAGNQFHFQPADVDAVKRGNELFHSVGCVACHSPRNQSATEEPIADSVPMGDLQPKYGVEGLTQFLEDPLAVRPSGHMPNMKLTHFEAQDIASFLLQGSIAPTRDWEVDHDLARQGKSLFAKLNCGACHTDVDTGSPQTPSQLALDSLDPWKGCLSDEIGTWPVFQFSKSEKRLVRLTLQDFPSQLTGQQRIDVAMQSFNCMACHDRADFGGVTDLRNPHFQTTNMNLGDQGRIPPTLTGVGAKLKPKWMRDVLVKGRTVRPYMKTRMPQYGDQNVGFLVDLFQRTDHLRKTAFPHFDDQKEMRTMGLEMAGNKGLNCVACHTYQYKLSDTMPAVDLTEMTDRLKKDWFHQYMLAPQRFSPNTVMPSFWAGGVAMRKDIPGSASFQIEALWQYLLDGRQARAPSGVVREPLEIVVDDEAQMLRRNFQGIGKRGIGVGYPGGVNLAFDPVQMRLATIWHGKFIDPAAAWTGQGAGAVRLLGPAINFTKGPDLDDAVKPWQVDDSRPPERQFQGYVLDSARRPTFRYRYERIDVEDFCSQSIDDKTKQTSLQRRVKLSAEENREGLVFRVASGKTISREQDGVFKLGESLEVRLPADVPANITDSSDGQQLLVPIDMTAGQDYRLMIQYRWK